jgi:hypothetical protein
MFSSAVHAEAPNPSASADSSQARYVWAKNLVLRGAPDSKSAELAKLPFGSAITIISSHEAAVNYQDAVLHLYASADSPAGDLVLSGQWQHVQAQQNDGWVFDAYLSRYPSPQAADPVNHKEAESELDFAKRVFGVKLEQSWKAGDSRKTADFSAMRKHTKVAEKEISDELSWTYAEFQRKGSSYEEYENRPGEVFESSVELKDVPLTFNEAVLWARFFDDWYAVDVKTHTAFTKFSGKVEANRHLEIRPSDDTVGVASTRMIDCSADSCDLQFQLSD